MKLEIYNRIIPKILADLDTPKNTKAWDLLYGIGSIYAVNSTIRQLKEHLETERDYLPDDYFETSFNEQEFHAKEERDWQQDA
jgi:hypothetical protein